MKLIASDIDGVLTDGRVYLDAEGHEIKSVCYRDLDAVGILRDAGFEFALITGESGKMAEVLTMRFNPRYAIYGAKDKLSALLEISRDSGIDICDIAYIGDSDRDVSAICAAGIGIAPSDASKKALEAADVIVRAPGGSGVLREVAEMLADGGLKW